MEKRCMERLCCSEKRAALVAKEFEGLSPALKPLLDQWISTGVCHDATMYNGYSLDLLMQNYGMMFTGALLTLDSMLKEPALTLTALAEPVR